MILPVACLLTTGPNHFRLQFILIKSFKRRFRCALFLFWIRPADALYICDSRCHLLTNVTKCTFP